MFSKFRNPFIQQYVLELLLPVLGYFLFEWDLFIIAIFYLLDFIADQILFSRRLFWVMKYGDKKLNTPLFISSILGSVFFASLIFMIFYNWITAYNNWPFQIFNDRLYTAFIEELWMLFPVLIAAGYLLDQFSFYVPRRFLNFNSSRYVLFNLLQMVIITLLLLIGFWLMLKLGMQPTSALFSFLGIKLLFDFGMKKIALKFHSSKKIID